MMACQSTPDETATSQKQNETDSEKVTSKDIANLKFTEFILSPDSKAAVSNWQRYQELMAQLEFLKQADFSFFDGKNELLKSFLLELKKNTPQELTTPAIKERLIALETKILKFHSTLKLSNYNKEELLQDIKDILVATSNLNLQINKKFELESQIILDPSETP